MHEAHPGPSREGILHVYPYQQNVNDGVIENYVLHDYKLKEERRCKIKFDIKDILKRRSIPRKFPRTTREHTEFDRCPSEITCPNCLHYIKTKTYHYNTGVTHAVAACLIPICMCIIPYYVTKYKNTAHYCPRCKIYLGTKYGAGRDTCYYCAAI